MDLLKADLHLHSGEDYYDVLHYSAYQLIDRCAELKYQVISIACHRIFTYCETWCEYAEERGILLLPGVEASIEGKHVLILNANEDANKLQTFEELKVYKHSNDVFIVAPHPFYSAFICLRDKLYQHADLFDAVEYHSYYTKFYNPNKKAQAFALQTGKPLIASSDCHQLKRLGKTYSLLKAERNVQSVLQALRKGDVQVVSSPLPAWSAVNMMVNLRLGDLKRILRQIKRMNGAIPDPTRKRSIPELAAKSRPVRFHHESASSSGMNHVK